MQVLRVLWIVVGVLCVGVEWTAAQMNVSVDDTDPSITYRPAGAWFLSANSSLDFGGAHMLTQVPNATATLNFTGASSLSLLLLADGGS